MNPKLTAERLDRGAMVYMRQSTPGQVRIIRRVGGGSMRWRITRASWVFSGSQ